MDYSAGMSSPDNDREKPSRARRLVAKRASYFWRAVRYHSSSPLSLPLPGQKEVWGWWTRRASCGCGRTRSGLCVGLGIFFC